MYTKYIIIADLIKLQEHEEICHATATKIFLFQSLENVDSVACIQHFIRTFFVANKLQLVFLKKFCSSEKPYH